MGFLLKATLMLLVVACVAWPGYAQDRAAVVEEIRSTYEQLDYGGAETKARRALATYTDFTVEQLVEIHTLLGLVTFTLNKPEEAGGSSRRRCRCGRTWNWIPCLPRRRF